MTDTRERARELCSCLGLTRLTEESEWIVDNVTADGITAFAESEAALARKQERLDCAKVLCEDCRIGEYVEPAVFHDGKWRHKAKEGLGAGYFSCDAAKIHERNLAETGGTK